MYRKVVWAAALSCVLGLAACGKKEDAAPTGGAIDQVPPVTEPAGQAVAEPTPAPAPDETAETSCSQDCGDGDVAMIQCAAGERAVCDCAAEPKARCEPAADAGMGEEMAPANEDEPRAGP